LANVWHVYQSCGGTSWLVTLAAVLAIPFSALTFAFVVARARAAKILAATSLIVSLLPVGIGAVGVATGRAKIDAVLESGAIEPEFRERIRSEGYREADNCFLVGAVAGALPLVLSLLAVGLVFVRPPRTSG
jgi:hypothetical protein